MSSRILLIEDEAEVATILRDNLEIEGYQVDYAETGERGIELALSNRPDLILLDVMLPRLNGYEVCQRVRSARLNIPIVMLTARDSPADRTAGLDLGADDYVGKPFDIGELLARIRAHLRRSTRGDAGARSRTFTFGDVTVDFERGEVTRRSVQIQLSHREFELLCYLIEHRGTTVRREQMLRDVWRYHEESTTRTVDNFVAKLRSHIEEDPRAPRHLLTVYGIGYRFVP
jgi:two-component system, OmpR family, response regulator VicR